MHILLLRLRKDKKQSLTFQKVFVVFDDDEIVVGRVMKNHLMNSFDDREIDYQNPSILYICGGSSCNYLDDLFEWRHEQGYVVNTASLGETGSSASSIKNYIQDAYYNWEDPPEYVALVGDVGGSYSVPTFYDGFGHNSYNNDCEGDLPYSQLDGDDFLPEVIIGRISVNSTSVKSIISDIIQQPLAQQKNLYFYRVNFLVFDLVYFRILLHHFLI